MWTFSVSQKTAVILVCDNIRWEAPIPRNRSVLPAGPYLHVRSLKYAHRLFSVFFRILHNMAGILRKGTFYIHDCQVHNTRENPWQALSAAYMQLPEYSFLCVQPCRRQKVSRPEQAFGSSLSARYCLFRRIFREDLQEGSSSRPVEHGSCPYGSHIV